jgi:hypothetical protein
MTAVNALYINKVTLSLIDEAKELALNSDSINSFTENWEKALPIIKISTSHKETHRIDESIATLLSKAEHGELQGFEEEKALLAEYLMQIKDDETVSFDSII